MTDINEPLPTTAVNAAPNVVSDLLELDESIAREIMFLTQGIEGYKNIRFQTERSLSLGLEAEQNIISRLLDILIRHFKRFVRDIYEGGATLGYGLGKLAERAELLDTASRTTHRSNNTDSFKITTRIANLSINYKPQTDVASLLGTIKATDPIFRGYFKWHSQTLGQIVPEIILLDPKNPASLTRLMDLLETVCPVRVASALGLSGNISNLVSPHLLGNVKLHVISKNPSGTKFDQLVGQEILILPVDESYKPLPSEITYSTFPKTLEQTVIRQLLTTTHDLESNFNLAARSKRVGRADQLSRYMEKLRNRIATEQLDPETIERIDQFAKLLSAYTNWLLNPYLNLISLYIRNMTAVLNVCEANN